MELLVTLLIVAVIVLLVGGVFAATGARGPWPGGLWFFLILFLATLAIGTWARPIGPRVWDVPWLTFLVAAVFVALLIAAATPSYGHTHRSSHSSPRPHPSDADSGPREPEISHTETGGAKTAATAVGLFLWIFLVVAGTILLLGVLFASAT